MKRSDLIIAVAAPVIGLLALVVGIATGDTVTAVIGAVALAIGLSFAIPLLRGR
jgi:uncharacterized membrane protein HdeD (DUF308 family)